MKLTLAALVCCAITMPHTAHAQGQPGAARLPTVLSPTDPAPAFQPSVSAPPPAANDSDLGGRCEANLNTPLGPRSIICLLPERRPMNASCACAFPPPPPDIPPSPPASGWVVR